MNREQAAKLLPIIQAWVEGKEIQVKNRFNPTATWLNQMPHDNHDFDFHSWEYRIKPEVKEGWINIYQRDGFHKVSDQTYATKESADRNCLDERFACIKITYTEGEGL